ncbi:MAG TPA: SPFH domain-containing protein [Candidatus Woesebacteria bacterium]|jgi:regulator of protease activity HflC (stomatin/prohibitin superfamily)|nr:SPFH domain-containing protein [Candidatus Woesebacteria bacterium]
MFATASLFIIFLIAISTIAAGLRIVKPYEKGLVIRLGKYNSTVESGLTVIVPYIDQLIKVDMREQVINVMPQQVITKDNVGVTVDAVIYYKVVDPVKAEFEIFDFNLAATTLAQTNLRNLIGDKQLDETLTARDHINNSLREVLDEATNPWGVKVTKVELQKIDPPQDITQAMSQQMKAEREKRARVLEAQGIKEAAILTAEGEAQSVKLRAEAQANAVTQVAQAAEKNFTPRAEKLKRLEVSEKVLGDGATKYVIPSSADIVNVLNLDGDTKLVPLKK